MSYFGKDPTDIYLSKRWNYNGANGYWVLPRGWYCRPTGDGLQQASPNADFSKPVYDVRVGGDGVAVVYDTMLNRITGRDNTNK